MNEYSLDILISRWGNTMSNSLPPRKFLALLLFMMAHISSCSTAPSGSVANSNGAKQDLIESNSEQIMHVEPGFISGNWQGSAVCQAPRLGTTKKYNVDLTLNHEGQEHYSGILEIHGISENRGSLTQLERIQLNINPVDGEYRLNTLIFMPFLKQRIRTVTNDAGQISAIHLTTIQRCRSFRVSRVVNW